MECRLQTKIVAMIESLALEHQQELAEAGTLADLEELTCEIGDLVTRELTQREVVRRAEAVDLEQAECPDCGAVCHRGDPDPVVLDGLRGQLAYRQPQYYCPRCRRAFFPSGGPVGTSPA
jgi:hypothetical protein